jgi:hypothetical protein
MRAPNTIEALKKRVSIQPNGCWEWTGARNSKGYGKVSWQGKEMRVHRIFHEHFNGPLPEGMNACHHCDNPPCCNPEHLFAGTALDNEWNKIDKRNQKSCHEREGSGAHLDLLSFSMRHYPMKKRRLTPFESTA